MKVYTRQGDDGTTALLTGERVSKTHSIIVTTGTIDELNSWLGLLRDKFSDPSTTDQIIHVQELLMSIATQITTLPDPKHLPSIDYVDESDVRALEKTIDQMSDQLPPLRNFVLPGGHESVSYTHLARACCRRSERSIVELTNFYEIPPMVLNYINRLSDYLFVLSRKIAQDLSADQVVWKPQRKA